MMNALKSGRSLPTIKSLIDCSSCRKQLSRPVTKAALTTNHDVTTNRHDDSTFGSTQSSNPRPLYLDVQATTPMVCPSACFCISHDFRIRVWWMQCYHTRYKAMCVTRVSFSLSLHFQLDDFGNPHSRSHAYGWESEKAVEDAREQVANIIGADTREIIFTSGATESNNIAIKGVANFYKNSGKDHVITVQTVHPHQLCSRQNMILNLQEHKCVLDSCRNLEHNGFKVTYLSVQKNGVIDLEVSGLIDQNRKNGFRNWKRQLGQKLLSFQSWPSTTKQVL